MITSPAFASEQVGHEQTMWLYFAKLCVYFARFAVTGFVYRKERKERAKERKGVAVHALRLHLTAA